MQLDDKLVDDRDAAHAESQQREDVLAHSEDVLPAPMVEAARDADQQGKDHHLQLLAAIRMILDRETITVGQLRMPQLETSALEALQVAVSGRSGDLGQFVYATDRRDLLEQALAALQPELSRADDQTARELHAQFADFTTRVGELRHQLTGLEDSQDELLEGHQKAALEAGAAEPGDKPKPKPTPSPSDPDAPRPATTLSGPERPEPPRPATTLVGPELPPESAPPTTLIGPERPEPPRPATTLVGPELPPEPAPPTTLVGPDRPEPARPATTLIGPELPPEPAPPTTLTGPDVGPDVALAPAPPESSLGDAAELATKAKPPWWKRPFG